MKWVIGVIILLVGFAVVVWLIGRGLPVAHTVRGTRTIPMSAVEAWELIGTVENWSRWRSDLESIEMLSNDRVRVADRHGSVTYQIEKPEEHVLVTTIDQEGLPYGGRWIWRVDPKAQGEAVVTITEEGEIYNPIFRFMARYVFGYESTIESVLEQLARAAPGR